MSELNSSRERFWRNPSSVQIIVAIIGAVAVIVAAIITTRGGSKDPSTEGTASRTLTGSSATPASSLGNASLARALRRGIVTAHASGGRVQAAVWVEGADRPIVQGDSRDERMRPWSMVRPAIMIAAFRAAIASGQPTPSPTLAEAIQRTLVRAENCANFRVVLGIQTLTGGREQARMAIARVFADAGADHFEVANQVTDREDALRCRTDPLSASAELDPLSVGVQFGTSAWTIDDAIAFAHALGIGDFGDAGRFTLSLMREPKRENQDPGAARNYTAPLNWGAGNVLARWHPAYKGGWGGAANGSASYLAGQIAVIDVAGRSVAIAVVFHPDIQPTIPCVAKDRHPCPPTDDPGRANVVEPIEAVLTELAQQFAAAG